MRPPIMKSFFAFALGGFLSFVPLASSHGNPSLPEVAQTEEISLLSPNGWQAQFRSDGSAKLLYGSNATDVAVAPKGSFFFPQIYLLLTRDLKENPGGEQSTAAGIRAVGQTSTTAFYIDNKSLIEEMMLTVRDRSTPFDSKRFKELLEKYPLAADEKRVPRQTLITAAMLKTARPISVWQRVGWLSEKSGEVDFSSVDKIAKRDVKESFRPMPISSRKQAFECLDRSTSMACRPEMAYEGKDFYYFSGGTTTYPVSDFSTGFAVDKKTGAIGSW